jgi:two-component system response regulator YesN
MIELDYNVYLILLLNWKAGADTSEIDHIFESSFQNVLDSCGFDLMGCIGVKVNRAGLIPVIKHLLRTCRNNLSDTSHRISLLNDELNNRNQYAIPDISYWAMLLEAGSDKKLIEEVSSFFSGIPDTLKKDSYYFKEIREDFLQMIFAVLKQKGVQAHQLFCDNVSNSYFENAPYSVHNMIIWMKHVITCSCNITQALSKEQTIIEKSIRYIKLHIEQDIKREDVSSYVYLNPDYLTRIFKKETGMSITEYIINERIKIAKKLLENTDMPVSSIALRVGYTNFSHFAKTFRKPVGMNPADFKNSLSVGCL